MQTWDIQLQINLIGSEPAAKAGDHSVTNTHLNKLICWVYQPLTASSTQIR